MKTKTLSATQIKSVYFKNPFAILSAPTELTYPSGRVTPELLMHYKALAQTEAALVIAGPAAVVPPNSRKYSLLRADQPKYLDGLRALTKIISSNGSLPGIHVTHPGLTDAHEMLKGRTDFKGELDWLNHDKLITAFRNACQRAHEVGFRYVELGAAQHLVLHQLIENDEQELLGRVFKAACKSLDDSHILALRMHPESPHREKYARLFLEAGGDLVCCQPHPDQEINQAPSAANRLSSMTNLDAKATPETVTRLLRHSCLIGVPANLPTKRFVGNLP